VISLVVTDPCPPDLRLGFHALSFAASWWPASAVHQARERRIWRLLPPAPNFIRTRKASELSLGLIEE
jgi:hypothetical protein